MSCGENQQRVVVIGKDDHQGTDNSVCTSKYTVLSFLPMAILEQFRRFANIYFTVQSILMMIALYVDNTFESSVMPWSVVTPLSLVIFLGLLKEAMSDLSRHRNDAKSNSQPCFILRKENDVKDKKRSQNFTILNGGSVKVSLAGTDDPESDEQTKSCVSMVFKKVNRKDVYAGDIILVRNHDMIPADLIVLGSSGEKGVCYIETSSIDGETNLKLRMMPNNPIIHATDSNGKEQPSLETIENAVKRVTGLSFRRLSERDGGWTNSCMSLSVGLKNDKNKKTGALESTPDDTSIIINGMSLTTEKPNASVNTFSGILSLPAQTRNTPSNDLPLTVDNLLLRGAMLRNTEWVIGVACFTGKETKLMMNSMRTPSKFSRLDSMTNNIVFFTLSLLLVCSIFLGYLGHKLHLSTFDTLWYVGYNENSTDAWPYLPDMVAPTWQTEPPSIIQLSLSYITLLYNIIPLSAFITLEMITMFMMFLINWDMNMYSEDNDTPAIARSTIVSDLGQVGYVFSDKTGTLTQNVMRFKRCSVDGMIFGDPVEKSAPKEKGTFVEGNYAPLESLILDECNKVLKGNAASVTKDGIEINHVPQDIDIQSMSSDSSPLLSMSFNAEMFLRTMSICHTVFVEKDLESRPKNMKNKSSIAKLFSSVRHTFRKRTSSKCSEVKCIDSDSSSDTGSISNSSQIGMGADGAPLGYRYQAESPDESALVSAASQEYGFQLFSRDSSGIQLACPSQSILAKKEIYSALKDGSLTPSMLASQTPETINSSASSLRSTERWSILAINKFDSDRKRMSVIVRSPPEFGSIAMLLCKGADSTMLHHSVCLDAERIYAGDMLCPELSIGSQNSFVDAGLNDTAILGLQAHLGAFACEGLRTLVLGIRILCEKELSKWLTTFQKASIALNNREGLLSQAANEIETCLHIIGATAIEDKLQVGVPETIEKIKCGGMKLWVLTGDKKETAIEIGYATKALTPSMTIQVLADMPEDKLKGMIANEFMWLVETGRLQNDQSTSLSKSKAILNALKNTFYGFTFLQKRQNRKNSYIEVCNHAKQLAMKYNQSTTDSILVKKIPEIQEERVLHATESFCSLSTVPIVFARAQSARVRMTVNEHLNTDQSSPVKDITSMTSDESSDVIIAKHLNRVDGLDTTKNEESLTVNSSTLLDEEVQSSRALVIDGLSLSLFLGNPVLEEMLFSVASHCDILIACRVTPKQKASMVKLVQDYAEPTPITLAIGDGANDISMIQAANVGVGIAGLEGQQAANSADFAIGQFRFLQDLLFVHGRWNFIRLSKVILYSFYKNAFLSGLLVVYAYSSVYSGTALFDVWIMAAFNFVCAVPIMMYGAFDRDLEAGYVKRNPHLYASGQAGEDISLGARLRWALITIVHITITYSIVTMSLDIRSSMTTSNSAYRHHIGDGESNDLVVYGTTMFTTVIFTLAVKILFESRSIINGDVWGLLSCKGDILGRLPYSWIGVTCLSILFYFGFMYGYEVSYLHET